MESLYSVDLLRSFIVRVIEAVGLSGDFSPVFADCLIAADLRGVKSHGIVRLPAYVQRVETGVMNPSAAMQFSRDEGATALLDAANGFGQVAGQRAMSRAVEKARTHGVGFVAVRNSNHFGIASFYAMQALDQDMIGIVSTNSSPAMNPYGTLAPLLGTNPIAIAVPAGAEKPIVLDMSTSVVARGKIRHAALTGSPIPEGWATDAEGRPTTDPREALKGSLEPIGGVKGSGLSLMVDILCGVLTDSCLTGDVKTIVDTSGPARTGHFFCALDVSRFMPSQNFKKSVDAVVRRIKDLPARDGGRIALPGEIEYDLAEKRRREGIPLDAAVVETLNVVAKHYDIGRLE